MRRFSSAAVSLIACGLWLAAFAGFRAAAADSLVWNTNSDRVSAEIQSLDLIRVLEGVSKATGWGVYVESNVTFNVSTRFDNLPAGAALRQMLGDLSFALVPETNAASRLYVFRSSQKNATRRLHPADLAPKSSAKAIPNELIVRVKPGTSIDALARALGAKVVGRMDSLNAYRLQFSDEAAANSARTQLAGNSDVAEVESNYYVAPPPAPQRLDFAGVPPVQLKLSPPDPSGRVVVGLVDSAVQPLGNDLDKFLLKSLSVSGPSNPDPREPTHGTSMYENILRAASAAGNGSSSMQVLSVNVADPGGLMNTFNVAAGMVEAVNNGATVINASLGGAGDSPILHDVVQQITDKGIPIFAAAGNNGSNEPFYPAAYREVIAITAGTQGKLDSYANFGSYVDLMAQGSGVVYFGNQAWLVSGTSTSTAFVSGTVGGTAAAKHAPINQVVTAILNSPAFKFNPVK